MIFLFALSGVIILLIALETIMLFLVRHPNVLRRLWRRLQNSIGYLYIQGERKIMQFHKGYGQYHEELGYTLKPGKFIFTEREYSNTYYINSFGVRDTEEALQKPDIVIIGDSYAFGWGVEQKNTFSKILEQKTGFKVLNTAIPSYGTVREMLMLKKVDRSRMKCLVIQYCGDDYDENMRFYVNGNKPQIMRAETFSALTALHSSEKKYYFGKYLLMKIKKRINESKPKQSNSTENSFSEIDLFINVLKENKGMLDNIPIVVFEMNGRNQINDFTLGLKQKICGRNNPSFINNMIILDMSQHLTADHFYVLDGHLNTRGHIIVSDVLYHTIMRTGIS